MKRVFSLLLAVITFSFFFICSCKKTQHPTNPTPDNYRLLSYTKVTDGVYPSENYSFYYDSKNRVSQILFSTNDPIMGVISKRAVFYYTNDSIFKVITDVRLRDTLEVDTFIRNSANQITTAYFNGGEVINYQYYGKLLFRLSDTFKHSLMSLATTRTYTSDNGDLLCYNFDGTFYASFPDSGLRVAPVLYDTDTILSTPLTVNWNVYGPTVAVTTHNINSFQDKFTGYTLPYPISISATDVNGIIIPGVCTYPGGTWSKESYGVFPDKPFRTGDYFQLLSFTTYGISVYQNAHLLKSVTTTGHTTNITYDIDGFSKVTQTTAATIDSVGALHSVVYKLQYETF